jgi:hypothetical protein
MHESKSAKRAADDSLPSPLPVTLPLVTGLGIDALRLTYVG